MSTRIVSAPMGAAEVRPGRKTGYLTHAVEIDERGAILRVLCGRVKLGHVLEDGALYDVHPVDCPTCARRMKQQR